MLKQRGKGRFHVVSKLNKCGVFVGITLVKVLSHVHTLSAAIKESLL